jgi:hypothetical protein
MKRSFHEEFGITVTLPLSIERRTNARRQLLMRRTAIAVLLILAAVVAAMGLYRPAKAALASRGDSVGQCVAQHAGVDQHREL